MQKKLPPLGAVRAFESSARHLSFSKAAKEMFLTQGAISKQIKILEEYLGKPLFERVNRGLKLTKKAEEYYANISVALDAISSSSLAFKNHSTAKKIITVSAFTSFANYWLMPRIENFQKKYPDIKIYVSTAYAPEAKGLVTDYDILIWGYKYKFNNLKNIKIDDEEMILVGAKSLVAKKIKNIKDLLGYTFLQNNYRPEVLNDWMKSSGIDSKAIKNTLSFDYLFMMIEGAKQGLGLAFIPKFFAQELIDKGILVNPLKIRYKTNFAYYIVYPQQNINEDVQKFSDWLLDELRQNKSSGKNSGKNLGD
ncbi:MAG: LysR substrate-binding domain-containing protein [Pseudomonadota bacterium]